MITYEELLGGVLKNKQKITFIKKPKEKEIIPNKIPLIKDYLNSPFSHKYNLKAISQKKNKKGINNNINFDNNIIQNNLFEYSNIYFNNKNNNLYEKEKINNKFNDKKDKYLKYYKYNGKLIINSIFNKENNNFKTDKNFKNLELGNIVNNNLFKKTKKILLNNMTYNNFKKRKSPTLKIKEISFEQNISCKSNSKKLDKNKNEDNKCINTIHLNTYTNKKIKNYIYINGNILNDINFKYMKTNKDIQAQKINNNNFNKDLKITNYNDNNNKDIIYKNNLLNKNETKTNDSLIHNLIIKRPYSNDKNIINNTKELNMNLSFNKTEQFFYKDKNNKITNKDNTLQNNDLNSKNLESNNSLSKMKINNKLNIRVNLDKFSHKNSINFNESEKKNEEYKNINSKNNELNESKNKRNILKINNKTHMRNNNKDLFFYKLNSFTSYNENENKKPLSSIKRLINEKKHMNSFYKEKNNKKKSKIEKVFIQKFEPKRFKNNNDDIIDLINQTYSSKEID